MEYFTVENCTPEQLQELRAVYFYSDDVDQGMLAEHEIFGPDDVPDWLVFQEWAGILFTNDDFFCSIK